MTPEREQVLDQNYALPTARELLLEAREYVFQKAAEENQFAQQTLYKIDRFLA